MVSLGEHVKDAHVLQRVANLKQVLQVARQGAGVAAYINDLRGEQLLQGFARGWVQAGARWVQQNQVGGLQVGDQGGQHVFHRAFVQADVVKRVQVAGEVKAGGS